MASLRFTDGRAQAIYEATKTSKSTAEFAKLLEDALKMLPQSEPPEQISDKRFKRGKCEFRSC